MLFSVIYTADYPVPTGQFYQETRIADVEPPKRRSLWELTEAHDEDAYWDTSQRWRHRKWAALLTRQQFDEFVRKTWLTASPSETMGSLGAPGFGFGWAPAVAFDYDGDAHILNAYVTPVPEVGGKPRPDLLGKHQDRIFAAVRKVYGDDWENIILKEVA